jgi:selenocysteine-specific elongation factor
MTSSLPRSPGWIDAVPIVGTAGHVDHGKSTLVLALTGRDPDRWAEEKRRGLTIDLGFAWTELSPGVAVGFVDVPGHERFIKNMLAGVGALDVAMLVVAADEGWMPQTEEHLAVLDLLGIEHGVIALTRTDLVDADTVELAALEIAEATAGTGLTAWPVVPVSPISGDGLDTLRQRLLDALGAAGHAEDRERPVMWIDRSFLISGAGAVVTGTLIGGSLHRGDEVEVWPAGRTARIRGLQTHEKEVETANPATRVAANLGGIDLDDLERGAVLRVPGQAAPSTKLLGDIRLVRSIETLTERGAYQVHIGSGAWPVRLRPVSGNPIERSGSAVLDVPEPLPIEMGDRFIIRETGRRAVVAGGRILDPAPDGSLTDIRSSVPVLRTALDGPPDERAAALLSVRGRDTPNRLAAHSGGGRATSAFGTNALVVTMERAQEIQEEVVSLAWRYHEENPLRPGIPKATLASRLAVDVDLLEMLIESSEGLVDDGATVRTSTFTGGWGEAEEAAFSRARSVLEDADLSVPRATQIGLESETMHAALRDGKLIKVAEDLVYLPAQIDRILSILATLPDGFTVADFRDALGVSRRHAVPLVEWLDAKGWTGRRGDTRVVRRRPEPGPSDAPSR